VVEFEEDIEVLEMREAAGLVILGVGLSIYRFIAGFAIILIPILELQMLPVYLILIEGTICIIQILIDLKHHPHHQNSNF
jgi:hypothetical protein